MESTRITIGQVTEFIDYTPEPIDEYLVIVNDASDWEEIHNYIINDNEIDGIPNREIECSNIKEYSLRSSVYMMSIEEAEILRQHPKIESVVLNPDKYSQPQSPYTNRYKTNISFSKPSLPSNADSVTPPHTNGKRSNWSHLFVNNPTSQPFKGVGITTVKTINTDVQYSLTGKNVDSIILDSGIGAVHPEFFTDNGVPRVKDLILDGPYKVDPQYFITNNLTYTKVIDGVNFGVGIASTAAREWWTNSSKRSSSFQSLGTVSSITSLYTIEHASSKTTNTNSNEILDGHGTACASQIGGKTFGLAFECNLWNIRISLSGWGGYLSASTALDICTIFHNSKKISQSGNPDPTLINNSYGQTLATGNNVSTSYTHGYRGNTLTYIGNGSDTTVQSNAGACRNTKTFTRNFTGSSSFSLYLGSGQYIPVSSGSATSSSAENAIAAGCIVVAAAGNNNQKLSDYTDIDYNNWYNTSTNYINRVGGVQKGFSGADIRSSGSIRVGALDCAVEPADSKQGSTPYAVRKVTYSNNGPMIDLWAPAEMTLAAGYTSSYEDYTREDNSSFYDTWFNGTSSAGPNACSVIALFLEANRKATQSDVRNWLDRFGTVEIDLSDPYPDPTSIGYWSQSYNATFDLSSAINDSYNVRGNGNLRGAPKKVLQNPYANNTVSSITTKENIVTDGLVLHLDSWNKDSYSGIGTSWNDLSGNGNNAELRYSYSYNDKSITFADSGYANVIDTSDFDFSGDFSLESWFYLTNTPNSTFPSPIFASWKSAFTSDDKIILFINSSLQIALQMNTGTNTLLYPSTISLNQWYHIVVSRINGVVNIYLNGVVGNSLNYSSAISPVLDMRIGAYQIISLSDPLPQTFEGKIPVARIYKDRGLTSNEVIQHYINQKGRFFGQSDTNITLKDPIVTDGLVLYLDASNKRSYSGSGTTWTDLSGNGNNATLINGPSYSSANGGSIVFDGVDDYVLTPITTTYQNFTLNCWFYNTSSSKVGRALISKNSYYAIEKEDWPVKLGLNAVGTSVYVRITSGTSFNSDIPSMGSEISSTLSSLNTWYNVTATYDKVNLKLYVNGVLTNITPNDISLPNNSQFWTIGRESEEYTGGINQSQYNGNIANVQIYNRALTASEIEKNYINQRGIIFGQNTGKMSMDYR